MNRTRRSALVLLGAVALSVSSIVAVAGPPSTAVRTIADRDGDNLLEYTAGEPVTVPSGYSTAGLHRLLGFAQMTDVHITDEESPGRLEFLDGIDPFGGAYRPNESLSTQTLEATVERIRDAVSPVTHQSAQFTVATGDMADSQQYNEARWLINTLDGGQTVTPDSGVYAGTPSHLYDGVHGGQFYDPSGASDAGSPYAALRNFPGLLEAAQQPFSAAGLGMPWYATFGNHDALIQGNAPIAYLGPGGRLPNNAPFPSGAEIANTAIQSIVTGPDKLTAFPPKPTGLTDFQWAAFNLQQLFTNPQAYLAAAKADGRTNTVPADPARCYIAKDTPTWLSPSTLPCASTSWVNELANTTGAPVGHGMVPATDDTGYGRPSTAIANHDGYYSFSPATGFRMVVLDSDTDFCATGLCDYGSLDSVQFAWLDGQLQAATAAGQHVILFSHHPLVGSDSVIQSLPAAAGDPTETWVSSPDVQAELCRYPAVLATVSGHTHHNHVDDVACGSGAASAGFVGVNTTSEMDYPSQARMIEVVQNSRGQLALVLTMIDNQSPPMVGSGAAYDGPIALASIAREIGYASDSPGSRAAATGTREDRNVLVPLTR